MKQNLAKLMESELDRAELILASKGISDEIQTMAEKVAKLSVDELMPLVDRLKEVFGNEMAQVFNDSVDGTLSSLLDQLKQSKDSVENQANVLNGEGDIGMGMDTDMGFNADPGMGGLDMGTDDYSDPAMGGVDGLDGDADDSDMFGADDAMAGGDEPLGRAMKENKKVNKKARAKKLAEMANRMRRVENQLKVLKNARA